MTLDLAVIGGTLISEEVSGRFDIGISDGKIVRWAEPGTIGDAKQSVSAEGLLVLPGGVDVHYHARTPGYPERGDFATETAASAAGGVTTILEMPISQPGCATPEILENRKRLGDAQCITDFGLYGAPGTLNKEDVVGMAAAGCCAFKIFLHRPPAGREEEFIGICLTEETAIRSALELVAETGLPLVAHCENDRLLESGLEATKASGRRDFAAHGESRPSYVEASSVATFLSLAAHTGARAHVAHVTCSEAVELIAAYRRLGSRVTAETCPHYLFFTEDEAVAAGPFAKINPPIRKDRDRETLWRALRDGTLDLVTTDHAPYLPEEKNRGLDDIFMAPSGAPGAQVLVPLMVSSALEGQREQQDDPAQPALSLREAVALVTSRPSKVFGLYPQKGSLLPGADADLCLYDPTGNWILTKKRMVSKAREIDRLYLDRSFRGHVVSTFLRGKMIWQEGELLASPGAGRFVRPAMDG